MTTTTVAPPTTYVIAVGAEPDIVCPPWCQWTKDRHLAELDDWEGRCLHRGERGILGESLTIDIVDSTNADGTREDRRGDRKPEIGLMVKGEHLNLSEAEEFIRLLQSAVDELRPWAERA